MRLTLILLSIFLIQFQLLQAAPVNVEIKVSFEGSKVNTLSYELPVNNCMLSKTTNSQQNLELIEGVGIARFSVEGPTGIRLWLNGERLIFLVVKPNDKIQINANRFHRGKYPEYNLVINGSAAAGHTLFNNNFIPIGSKFSAFENFARASANYDEYFLKSKAYVDSISIAWYTIADGDEPNRHNYLMYEQDIRAALYKEAILKLTKVPVKNDYQNYTKWQDIRQLMFFYGGVRNDQLMKTHFGYFLLDLYYSELIRKDPSIIDSTTKQSDYNYRYFYPKVCADAFNMHVSRNDSTTPFPGSAILSREVINNLDSLASTLKHKKTLICYWSADDALSEYEIKKMNLLLPDLIKLSLNIIFISKDPESAWTSAISKRNYGGSHYRITDSVETTLLSIVGANGEEQVLSTPDFFLYDAESKKLETQLPFPNSGRYFVEYVR